MHFTRRSFGLAAGASLVAGRSIAQIDLGGGTLTTVSDGHLVLPSEFILGPLSEDQRAALNAESWLTGGTFQTPCNLALYREDGRTVLFDAGSGPNFMPTAGQILDSLDAAGVSVDDVTDVIFTHAHPDHIWGVLDDFDEPLFPGATHHIGQAEADFWMDPATVEAVGEARASFAVGARNRLEAIADGMNTFGDGDTVVPGVVARASFGHTPGHMSFLVNDAALVVGDAIGNGSLALVRPDLPYEADQDPETGVATRTAMLAELADTGLTTVGFHLPNRGLGRLEKNGEGYRFVAVDQ